MAQPVKKEIKKVHKIKKVKKTVSQGKKKHKEYGTSKLEEKFAKEFLEKLGVNYVYQYKAESIGRFFDFYIPSANLIIEIDGDYWHSYNVEYKNMTPTQKRNKRVDEAKDKWAVFHGIPVLRIWEHDINKNPAKVMQILKEKLSVCSDKVKLEEEKKKRH